MGARISPKEGSLLGKTCARLGHAQTGYGRYFQRYSLGGRSSAASGYQSTMATGYCCSKGTTPTAKLEPFRLALEFVFSLYRGWHRRVFQDHLHQKSQARTSSVQEVTTTQRAGKTHSTRKSLLHSHCGMRHDCLCRVHCNCTKITII